MLNDSQIEKLKRCIKNKIPFLHDVNNKRVSHGRTKYDLAVKILENGYVFPDISPVLGALYYQVSRLFYYYSAGDIKFFIYNAAPGLSVNTGVKFDSYTSEWILGDIVFMLRNIFIHNPDIREIKTPRIEYSTTGPISQEAYFTETYEPYLELDRMIEEMEREEAEWAAAEEFEPDDEFFDEGVDLSLNYPQPHPPLPPPRLLNEMFTILYEKCIICFEFPPTILFCHCGHIPICGTCNENLKNSRCPICSNPETITRNLANAKVVELE